jgi:signal transduction histidine kinase
VRDNGRGFDSKSPQAESGLGLQSMGERLHSIGGTLHIQSSMLHGTTVFAEARFVPAAMTQAPETMQEETSDTSSTASVL